MIKIVPCKISNRDSVGVQYYREWFLRKKVRVECTGTCSRANFPRDAFLKNSKINQIISLFILWVEPKCGGYSSVIERWSLSQVFRHISLRFQFKGSDINKIINFHFWNKLSQIFYKKNMRASWPKLSGRKRGQGNVLGKFFYNFNFSKKSALGQIT